MTFTELTILAENDFMSGLDEYEWLSTPVYYSSIEFFPHEREALISNECEPINVYLSDVFHRPRNRDVFINDLKQNGFHTTADPTDVGYWEYTTDKNRHENNLKRYKKMAAHKKCNVL